MSNYKANTRVTNHTDQYIILSAPQKSLLYSSPVTALSIPPHYPNFVIIIFLLSLNYSP